MRYCGRNYSGGICHLRGVGRHHCRLRRSWFDEIREEEGVPEPAVTADLFSLGGDLVIKLRPLHILHVLYGWKYHHNYVINKNKTMSLWRFLKRSPAWAVGGFGIPRRPLHFDAFAPQRLPYFHLSPYSSGCFPLPAYLADDRHSHLCLSQFILGC